MLKQPRGEISKRVGHIAALLDLEPFMERRPAALSGGQRQRVAMGRALVREPAVFLMDEPLSNLDAKLRVQMRREVVALQKRLGTTTLYVTHDQTEAMTMGDRLAVLHAGRLEQVGSPAALYERPDSLFVATFIGSPGMNLIAARLETAGEGEPAFRFGEQVIRLGAAVRARQPRLGERVGADVVIGIRPEVFVPAGQAPTAHQVSLRVEACEMLGHETLVHARAPVRRFPYGDEPPPDDTGGALLIARLPAVTDLAPGDRLEVAIDADRCTVFDPAGPVI
jgi:multiple sugar transport system ATP-binding protein